MPKLNKDDMLRYGTSIKCNVIIESLNVIEEEQGKDFIELFLCGSIMNPHMGIGFITAYMMIRDALIRSECNELRDFMEMLKRLNERIISCHP